MSVYVLPQVQVFQEFTISPVSVANPLRACVQGGNSDLIRYSEATERERGLLGYYDSLIDTPYLWPGRPAGGVIDFDYVKVFLKDALLNYFSDSIGSSSVITKLAGANNRVRSATLNFAGNGIYTRDAVFLDRDVQIGDVAKVRGIDTDTGDPITLWTYVKAIVGDALAAVVGAAVADVSNAVTQGSSEAVVKVAGPDNCVEVTANVTGYDGMTSGFIDETYDILVVDGSSGGDYTTASLRIISGSGTDDVMAVTPSARGVPTEIGTRGLLATLDSSDTAGCSESADAEGVSPIDLLTGQRYRITVHGAFTSSVATSGGTYSDQRSTTYIVEVSSGGLWADKPRIMVTTTNGIDLSGATIVTGAATSVVVGTKGVTISFAGTGLRKGDRYYIACTGVASGPMRTLVLGHNLSTQILTGSEVDLTLFIRKPVLEINQNRTGEAPLTNWAVSETEVTVSSGIIAYDPTWTNNGVPQPLDVSSEASIHYGKLYVEYRAWLPTLCSEINAISDVGNINDIPGPLHPDNPLKWGLSKALTNSNGTEVKYSSVCDPGNPDSWADAIGLTVGRNDVYGMVPLTRDQTVLDLYVANVDSMSSAEEALWRVAWLNLSGMPQVPIVSAGSTVPGFLSATTSDGDVATAIIEDDPDTSGTQYTIVRDTAKTSNYIANNVRAGDILRCLFTGDGFGNETYSEFVIDEVQAEDQLRLLTGPGAPINMAAKVEIWRNLTPTEEAAEIGKAAGSYGNRRVRAVWPDSIESSGTIQEGFHLCAALAGLVSGVLPHQGLTNLAISGFSNVARTTAKFNRTQLDAMAGSGVWIVTQDPISGEIYSRQALSTAAYDDLNQREEAVTRNVDGISYRFKDHFRPFIGVTNVTAATLVDIRSEATGLLETLMSEGTTKNLGSRLTSGDIVDLAISLAAKDTVIMTLDLVVPYALNVLRIQIVV